MNKAVIVLGGGGHAKVCIDLLIRRNIQLIGYSALENNGVLQMKCPYIGDDDTIFTYSSDEVMLVNGIGSIAESKVRRQVFDKFSSAGYSFLTLIHDTAIISQDVVIQEGAQIMAGSIVQAGSVIGKNTIINTRVTIDHDCRIGQHSHVSPGAIICGGVSVGNSTHVGAGATVIQKLSIGNYSIVGAGAVVLNNVLDYRTVYGVPAKEANNEDY